MPIPASSTLPVPAYPWRRTVIALWVSAAAHLLLLGFIRINPAPAHHQATRLQVRLDALPAEAAVPLLQSEVTSAPLETVPLPQPELTAAPSAAEPPPKPAETAVPRLDLPQLADSTYYDVWALDSPNLQPVDKIEPVDPEAGAANPRTGYVRLQLKLEADGRVSEATVLETNLPPEYEKAATDAFARARFYPARKNGRQVRARFKVELRFKLPPAADSR